MNGCTKCKVEPWMDHGVFWWTVPDAAPRKYCEGSQGAETECMCTSMKSEVWAGCEASKDLLKLTAVRSGLGLEV